MSGADLARRAAAVVVIASGACQDREPDELAVSSAVLPPLLTVVAHDYYFEAPDQVPAGVTRIVLENRGPEELHHVALVKLEEGRSSEEFIDAALAAGMSPGWARHLGGVEDVPPEGSARATVLLEPGDYLLVCYVGFGRGKPHFARGMLRRLDVLPSDNAAREPRFDVLLTMLEYAYVLSDSLEAGQRTIKVVNGGSQPHNVLVFRLEPKRTLADFVSWWLGSREGPAPARAYGGLAALDPDRHAYFSMDFSSGRYVFFCMVEDREDGRPHLLHGMVREVVVP